MSVQTYVNKLGYGQIHKSASGEEQFKTEVPRRLRCDVKGGLGPAHIREKRGWEALPSARPIDGGGQELLN
jgi:hypothetical protein